MNKWTNNNNNNNNNKQIWIIKEWKYEINKWINKKEMMIYNSSFFYPIFFSFLCFLLFYFLFLFCFFLYFNLYSVSFFIFLTSSPSSSSSRFYLTEIMNTIIIHWIYIIKYNIFEPLKTIKRWDFYFLKYSPILYFKIFFFFLFFFLFLPLVYFSFSFFFCLNFIYFTNIFDKVYIYIYI